MRLFLALGPLLLLAAGAVAPPATPVITEPDVDGKIVNPADLHMEAWSYFDPDGNPHASTDVEIWKLPANEKIWQALTVSGIEKNHLHLADGTFVGSYTGRRDLEYDTDYRLQFRFRDSTGEVSPWAQRFVKTSPAGPPGVPGPVPYITAQGYKVEVVAEGFEMPVNIAFVPNPGPNATDPMFYVTELYGTVKVVLRNGTVGTYAGASALGTPAPNPASLINFNPTGLFPGSGEQGLAGICVDPATGDVFVALLYASPAPSGPHYPKILRFSSTDGGRTASSMTTVLEMPGETQGQSHFISNLSIGPDGKLYVHNGDGFDYVTAQNLDSYRGKILRMNLNGTPATDNPMYNATNGINSRDYIWAYGLRNPFGGAWRASDGAHYEVENGPSVDRFAKVVAGRNLLWDNTDASMANFAIHNWSPAHGPVNVAFVQPSTFTGSGFPAEKMDHAFVTESGPTYGQGPQQLGKRIVEFVLDGAGNKVSGPTTLVEYAGTGRGSCVGLACGPDGLYFTELYKDQNATSPVQAGARVFRVRYVGTPPANGSGLAGTYYNGVNFDLPLMTRTDATVNFQWGTIAPSAEVPADNFSVRWTGFVVPVSSESYTFTTNSDDGVRLWVNNQLLVNNWTDHGATENSGQIVLQAGQPYEIKMEYYERTGDATAQLYWATATVPKQIIPQTQLSPATPPPPGAVAAPTFSPTPGTFTGPISVTIATTTAGASIRYTTDGTAPTSTTGTLYTGPVLISATTTFRAIAYAAGMTDSAVTNASYTYTPSGAGTGLTGDYYTGINFNTFAFTRVDPTIDFQIWNPDTLAPGYPEDNFSIRWTGKVLPQYTETYTFFLTTDDGGRLWVNNQLIVDKWIDQGFVEWSGTIALVAGQQVDVKIEFYEKGGGAGARLAWSSPSQAKQVIPQARLFPANAPPPGVAAPTFTPTPGTFSSPMSVTIASATAGASIRYTTDGSTPTSTTGTPYSAPVPISATTTFKAIAYSSGMTDSSVTTATYTYAPGTVANPSYSPAPGSFSSPMSVTISTTTAGASIRYTTDGSAPTSTTGILYSGPVAISATTAFRAIAFQSGMFDSAIVNGTYTYTPPVAAAPTFAPTPGTFSSPISVTISTVTAGASIRYTTDGSTPTSTIGTPYSAPVPIGATTTFQAIAYGAGMLDSSVTTATYTYAPAGTGTGLTGDYYTGRNFETFAFTRVDPTINFQLWNPDTLAPGYPADNFSIRWTGKVLAQFTQTYTFYLATDDGGRLWVNGQLLVDKWKDQGLAESSGTVALVAGQQVDVKVEYYEKNGGAAAFFSWSSPSTPKAIVPASALYPVNAPPPAVLNPTYSPTPGNFSSPMSVTISTATTGASIRYTTDGSAPTSTTGIVYSAPVAISATTSFRAIATKAGMTDSAVVNGTYTFVPPVTANPTYSPIPGNFSSPMSVTISTVTTGASIRYTTDGSAPTSTTGILYSGPVAISATTAFRAIAYKAGNTDSAVVNATYTFVPPVVANPSYSPPAGPFASPMSVTISTTTAGASIRYTTDGSNPTSSTGTIYSAPVPISATTSFKAIAYAAGMTDSAVTSATYTYSPGTVANPTYSPTPGTFSSPMSVTIASATAGASIRYTTDGTAPTSTTGIPYSAPVAISASTSFRAIAYKSGMIDSAVVNGTYTYSPSGTGTGLTGDYYTGMNFDVFAFTRVDPTINFQLWDPDTLAPGFPYNTYSIRWTGKVLPQFTETYTFFLTTDDGGRLWVNNQLIVDKWIDQAFVEWSGTIALVAGQQVDIKIEYYEKNGGSGARLAWSSPSQPKQVVPQVRLFPSGGGAAKSALIDGAALQSVLDASLPGETVTLGIGSYTVPAGGLFVPAGVSLKGAGPGNTFLDGAGAPAVVRLLGGSSKVEGMTLSGGTVGLHAGTADAVLAHLVVARNAGDGVVGEAGGTIDARFLTIADNGGIGFTTAGTATLNQSVVIGGVVGATVVSSTVDLPIAFVDPAVLDYQVVGGSTQGAYADDPQKSASPAPVSSSSGGGCGFTGLEAAVVLALLALARRQRSDLRPSR